MDTLIQNLDKVVAILAALGAIFAAIKSILRFFSEEGAEGLKSVPTEVGRKSFVELAASMTVALLIALVTTRIFQYSAPAIFSNFAVLVIGLVFLFYMLVFLASWLTSKWELSAFLLSFANILIIAALVQGSNFSPSNVPPHFSLTAYTFICLLFVISGYRNSIEALTALVSRGGLIANSVVAMAVILSVHVTSFDLSRSYSSKDLPKEYSDGVKALHGKISGSTVGFGNSELYQILAEIRLESFYLLQSSSGNSDKEALVNAVMFRTLDSMAKRNSRGTERLEQNDPEYQRKLLSLVSDPREMEEIRASADNRVSRFLDGLNKSGANLADQSLVAQADFLIDRLLWIHPTRSESIDGTLKVPADGVRNRYFAFSEKREQLQFSLGQLTDLDSILNASGVLKGINIASLNRSRFTRERDTLEDFSFLIPTDKQHHRALRQRVTSNASFDLQLALRNYENLFISLVSANDPIAGTGLKNAYDIFANLSPEKRWSIRHFGFRSDQYIDALTVLAPQAAALGEVWNGIPNEVIANATADLLSRRVSGPSLNAEIDALQIGDRDKQTMKALLGFLVGQSQEVRSSIVNLILTDDTTASSYNLFSADSLEFFAKINAVNFKTSLALYRNPISSSFAMLFDDEAVMENKDYHHIVLGFTSLQNEEEMDQIFAFFESEVFSPGGNFGVTFSQSLMNNAYISSNTFGYAMVVIYSIPIVAIVVLMAWFVGAFMLYRDRQGSFFEEDHVAAVEGMALSARPVSETMGRKRVISRLRGLSTRGWSAIGVVGKRGIGKTLILKDLIEPPNNTAIGTAKLRVWMSAPTRFSEKEFITAIYERFTSNVERQIASNLSLKPLATRRALRTWSLQASVFCLMMVLLWFFTFFAFIGDDLDAGDGVIFLFSAVCIVGVALACLIHFRILQPVNLTNWIERDVSIGPATAMLYRETAAEMAFIGQATKSGRGVVATIAVASLVFIISWGVTFGLFYAVTEFTTRRGGDSGFYWFDLSSISPIISFMAAALLSGAYIAGGRGLDASWDSVEEATVPRTLDHFRKFADQTVVRIRQGALGEFDEILQEPEVIVCIDELDKVVDVAELRELLVRLKSVLEVRGVYFYISLADDAFRLLYTSSTGGKNEIDSTFDHIVYVAHLGHTESLNLVSEYLNQRLKVASPALRSFIAIIGFGVPRDILRRCDELVEISTSYLLRDADGLEEREINKISEQIASQHLSEVVGRLCNIGAVDESFDWSSFESLNEVRKFVDDTDSEIKEVIQLLLIKVAFDTCFAANSDDSEKTHQDVFLGAAAAREAILRFGFDISEIGDEVVFHEFQQRILGGQEKAAEPDLV